MEKTPFQIFEQMSKEGNNELKAIPFSNIKNVKSIKLINQSVTGLFEQEIELLNL